MKTHEELSADQLMRLQAAQMAMGYAAQHIESGVESGLDISALAAKLYEFIKGETK